MARLKIGLAAVAIAAAAGFGVWHSQRDAGAAVPLARPKPSIPVTVVEARRADVPLVLSGLGVIQPLNVVTVRSRVDGEVMQVAFEEGREVKEGDLLVQIDPRPYRAALDQAKAKQAQDAAQLSNAERDLARSRQLAQSNFASRQQVDSQASEVARLKALIQADEAAVEAAQIELDYTTIRAPMRGRTGFRLVDKGNLVRSSDATGIVTLSQTDPITAVFTLPERDFPDVSAALRRGRVDVIANAPDGRELARGELSVLNSQIDQTTGTFKAKATFANADMTLWPGQSVSVRASVGALENVVTIPDDALQRGPQGAFAFVAKDDGSAERRPVTVSLQAGGVAVVTQGLGAGERVVTAGASRVAEGARLDVSEASRAEAPAAATSGAAKTGAP